MANHEALSRRCTRCRVVTKLRGCTQVAQKLLDLRRIVEDGQPPRVVLDGAARRAILAVRARANARGAPACPTADVMPTDHDRDREAPMATTARDRIAIAKCSLPELVTRSERGRRARPLACASECACA
jgi:hypothetical protein